MEFHEYLKVLKNKKQTVFSIITVFLVFSAILIFTQSFKYGAQTKLLVVQNTQGSDPYQVNKANEYVSDVLADVILTNSFFNEIMGAGFSINADYFPKDLRKQLSEWKKTVKTDSSNRGILTINVFHKDRDQADQIIRAINAILKSKHALYHGSGEQVSVRIIDQPFVSDYPVKPNIPLNLAFAIVIAFIFAFSYIYLFPESKYDLRLFPSRKKTESNDDSEGAEAVLNLPGVDKNSAYDVNEAIHKLRQREKQEGQAYVPEKNSPANFSGNFNNFENTQANDISKQGSMDNVF